MTRRRITKCEGSRLRSGRSTLAPRLRLDFGDAREGRGRASGTCVPRGTLGTSRNKANKENSDSMTRLLAILGLAIAICSPAFAEEPIRHSFFIAGPSFTGIIDEEGKEVWDSGRAAARDGFVLPNGNVLIAWSEEVKEFAREKKVVF